MAHHQQPTRLNEASIRLADLAPWLMKRGIALAILGFALAAYYGLRDEAVRPMFFHCYLVAFVFFLSMTLGAIFFMILHHLARAGWSVTLRRLAEGMAGNVYLLFLLALPLIYGIPSLYSWARMSETVRDAELQGKSHYLTTQWVLIRGAGYFAIWMLLVSYFRSRSIRQDTSGDVALSRSMERTAAPGMMLFGFSLTCAAFDLIMSMNPHWFSTIFGVYFFAGSVLSFLIVMTLLAQWLQRAGRLRGAVTVEHYHDLGKLTFAFVFFWGYIAFSQYMLIWYANLPEETQFFIPRTLGPWKTISLILLFCHLFLPFGGMMSRHSKRRLAIFTFWGAWLLLAHLVDMFWLIMPNWFINQVPGVVQQATGETHLSLNEALQRLVISNHHMYTLNPKFAAFAEQVRYPLTAVPLLITGGLVVGMGGLYMAGLALNLRGPALVPVGDPRLPESLAFENA